MTEQEEISYTPFANIRYGVFGFVRLQLGFREADVVSRQYRDVYIVNKFCRTAKADRLFNSWIEWLEAYEPYLP